MNKKTILCVLIAFFISFSVLYISQSWSKSYVEIFRLEEEFFSSKFDPNEKKIFIIGSSEIGMLNATYINKHISETGYTVYNLAVPSDTPSQRLRSIEKVITLKPELVIYGVGYRDFSNKNTLIKPENMLESKLLPSPNGLLHNNKIINAFNEILHIDSPKFVTVQILNSLTNSITKQTTLYDIRMDKTPFYFHAKEVEYIKNSTEIRLDFEKRPPNLGYLDSPDENDEVHALDQIVDDLQKNNIPVVVFTTPHARIFLENLNQQNKNAYDDILKHLSEQNIKIYRLDDKYQDLDIWYDYYHVSINEHATIFDDDIIKMINNYLM